MKLVHTVDASSLGFGLVGGSVYQRLKNNPNETPSWEQLSKAALWSQKDRFGKVQSWLQAGPQWNVKAFQMVPTTTGKVMPVEVDIEGRKEKLHCGAMGAILNTRSVVSLIYAEVKAKEDHILPPDVMGAIGSLATSRSAVRLIIWGDPAVVERLAEGPLKGMQEDGGPLSGYKSKRIRVFLPREDVYGPRGTGVTNVERLALILCPHPMKPSYSYVVSHVAWGPSILDHLIQCAGITMSPHKGAADQYDHAHANRGTQYMHAWNRAVFPIMCSGCIFNCHLESRTRQRIDRQLPQRGDRALAQGTSKDHLVYVPDGGIGLQETIGRAASMVCALPYWNVSVVLPGELDSAEIAGLVRVTTANMRTYLPFMTAHRDAMAKGQPISKNLKPQPEEEEEETLSQVRSQKQTVLYPHAAVPGAKVVPGVKTKQGNPSATRATATSDKEEAEKAEKAAQEKAAGRAKRQRDADLATAMARGGRPSKKKAPGLPKPPPKTRQTKQKGKLQDTGLGFLGEPIDEEE